MIALHARRSHASIVRYSWAFPERPLVVTLTGTDVYRDIHGDADARQSLVLASRLIVLQEMALHELESGLRSKVRVVYQSARRTRRLPPLRGCFEIVVSGHLRSEKDPFRAAAALRHLPATSRLRVTHVGGALSKEMAAEAARWMAQEPRYRWHGEVPHGRALQFLARSRAMVISSELEGGANVVSEALRLGTPVIASRISGNIGMLGKDYPGYYTVRDDHALAAVLARFETDTAFRRLLAHACAARAKLVTPARESAALANVLAEVTRAQPRRHAA